MNSSRYSAAGVDIDAKAAALSRAKSAIRSTFTPGVLGDVGGFGGLFQPDLSGFREPVLVASTDGVGTKLKLAFDTGRHDLCGADLVNHCVNDILVQGARPLFFLDYVATGKLDPDVLRQVIEGIARGCRENGVALLGGETAEMPGFYAPSEYDVAGTIVGIVERAKILDGSRVVAGDVALGLPSAGLHTNGYSLARDVLFQKLGKRAGDRLAELDGATVGDALLAPHLSYRAALEPLLAEELVHAMAHVTGGGFFDNIPRVVPGKFEVVVKAGSWPVPPIFDVIQRGGSVSFSEMHRVFNMGIGMVVFVAADSVARVSRLWSEMRQRWYAIGNVRAGSRGVVVEPPQSPES
ncbi:MAG TPA: phosphoribosylformylglycinamidine cyclo-ligase [Thermoanaerobaculia bacterium]|nr:phosphoribosylformylglycinamidine cyclo-ligase [Thermoanaerobaculia bacterium]